MAEPSAPAPTPSPVEETGEGVRVIILEPAQRPRRWLRWLALPPTMLALAVLLRPEAPETPPDAAPVLHPNDTPSAIAMAPRAPVSQQALPTVAPDVTSLPDPVAPGADPWDLASYFRPGDAAPSMRAVIAALHESGIHEGLGAFNPPGTQPPLEGLAVPEDFPLPPGFVRHHQVTDDGQRIEPILLFSEEVLAGRDGMIPPGDRVVPPELAPAGLPLRWVTPGKP